MNIFPFFVICFFYYPAKNKTPFLFQKMGSCQTASWTSLNKPGFKDSGIPGFKGLNSYRLRRINLTNSVALAKRFLASVSVINPATS